jgi:hypothetical protein
MDIYTPSKKDIESLYFPIDAPTREELKELDISLSGWGGSCGEFQPIATEAARLFNTGRPQTEDHKLKRAMAKSRSVTVNGIEYKSQKEAAINNNVNPTVIVNLIKVQGRNITIKKGNIACPHCDKIGINPRAMKRWHYDNCKKKG